MAAIFFTSTPSEKSIFKSGLAINNSVRIPFMTSLIGGNGNLIVTEVTVQGRDTVQYFLTFDDLITYYYFGKGLGSLTISGMVFSDCNGYFGGLHGLTQTIGKIRGKIEYISFGNVVLSAVLSNYTLRSSSEMNSLNFIDFSLSMDIINHSLPAPVFNARC